MRNISREVILARQKSAREYSIKNPPKKKIVLICCIAGCMRQCQSFSFCNMHYQEWLQYGKIKSDSPIESLDGEIWKDVVGYEGLYKVSNLGRVWSVTRESKRYRKGKYIGTMRVNGKIMKPDINNRGYCSAVLSKEGEQAKKKLIHRLVAEAFIPNPKNYPQVNHIDCNPANNKLDNLEWCDQSWQELHKAKMGRRALHTLVAPPVPVRITESGETYDSLSIAERETGVPIYIILNRLRSGKPDPSGNHWEYVV